MRALIAGALFALGLTVPGAADADEPVVIELFTSQGCSSCPPADAMILELAKRDDVIPLALHVDYWDYIGWKDSFARPAHTERQKAYARAAGHRTVFTPQIIVDGIDHMVGNKPMQLAQLIDAHGDRPRTVGMELERHGASVRIRAEALTALPEGMIVHVVRYLPQETVSIKRGENAGRTITYANIVTEWQAVARWDGATPLEIEADAPGPLPVVALVQAPGHGAILGAAQTR